MTSVNIGSQTIIKQPTDKTFISKPQKPSGRQKKNNHHLFPKPGA